MKIYPVSDGIVVIAGIGLIVALLMLDVLAIKL